MLPAPELPIGVDGELLQPITTNTNAARACPTWIRNITAIVLQKRQRTIVIGQLDLLLSGTDFQQSDKIHFLTRAICARR